MEDALPAFGDLLATMLKQRGLSMAAFGERVGMGASTLSRIRTGKRAPSGIRWPEWQRILACSDEELSRLQDAALLDQAPEELRRRLAQAEQAVNDERSRRTTVEGQFTAYRHQQNYYDGFWLSYNASFLDDGRIMRSLVRVRGGRVAWVNMHGGKVQFSYTGEIEHLGPQVYIRLSEDRGESEYVQVTCNALFDFQEPAFLYGIAAGISGRTVRHPISYPAAARILLLHLGSEERLRRDPEVLGAIEASLGTFTAERVRPFFPAGLGSDVSLRECLGLKPREDLDAVIEQMLSNRIADGSAVLSAGF
jgi:transcriptional regulator with XRE-family HTH domain